MPLVLKGVMQSPVTPLKDDFSPDLATFEQMIANLEPTAECKGNLLKMSVSPDGKYTVTNVRNGFSKTYSSR